MCIRALPEFLFCQIVIGIILWFPMKLLNTLVMLISTSGDSVVTTANIESFLSPKGLGMLACNFIMVLLLVAGEINAPIILCEAIQKQEKAGVFSILKRSIKSIPRFFTPSGFLIILYILIVSPLISRGIYLSMTKNLHIPNFIMEVIYNSLSTAVFYKVAILVLTVLWLIHIFVFHCILLDGDRPGNALRRSRHYFAKHWKNIFLALIMLGLIIQVLGWIQSFVFNDLPQHYLDTMSSTMPRGYIFNIDEAGTLTKEDRTLLFYRFLCILQVYISKYALNIFEAISLYAFFMVLTLLYLRYRREDEGIEYTHEKYDLKPRNTRHIFIALLAVIIPILIVCMSIFMATFFNKVFPQRAQADVIAHRTGGYLASENSLEGLDEAAAHDCFGSETDVQRTADRHYIINHDTDFARLTGVSHKPSEMTLEEVTELRIHDTTGNGELLSVPTLEEMLDHSKGKVKLFLELKGESADHEMVDDVVKAVKERDMVNDVVLISLNYDVINYAENSYPEFETGALIFGSVGDVTKINCDIIIMEEEMSVTSRIRKIHEAGKKVGVWTVNTEYGMRHFLDSEADMVITDDILMADEVKKELDERSDYEVLDDRASDLWFY